MVVISWTPCADSRMANAIFPHLCMNKLARANETNKHNLTSVEQKINFLFNPTLCLLCSFSVLLLQSNLCKSSKQKYR